MPTDRKTRRRESDRAYREANRERRAAYQRAWRTTHANHVRTYKLAWNTANPDKANAHYAASRARRRDTKKALAQRAATVETTIRALIPAHLPADMREELYQDLAVVYLTTGTVNADSVKAALKDLRRRYPLLSGRELSLNQPAYRDGSREEWIDRLTAKE